MVAGVKRCSRRRSVPLWHAGFLAMLPVIRSYARSAFAGRDPEARQELVQEVISNAMMAYVRLFQQGRVALAYPTVLAMYGIAQVREGRRVGGKLNVKDVTSVHCQRQKGVVVERLDHFDEEENSWREILIEDRRAGPADTAIVRIDFGTWLQVLPRRLRRIAEMLAMGETTGATARKFSVSAARISQIRTELKRAWERFRGDQPVPATA